MPFFIWASRELYGRVGKTWKSLLIDTSDMLPTSTLPYPSSCSYKQLNRSFYSHSYFVPLNTMVLPASDSALPTSNNATHETLEISDDLDFCMSTAEHFHELKFMAIEESKKLVRKESMQKEKQISVDPMSLRESSRRESSFNFMLPPVSTTPTPDLPPPVLPSKSQLITCSLPSSACSSPRFSFTMLKKKWKNESQASPRQIDKMASRHSSAHAPLAAQQEIHLRRSKSCAEGRTPAPADELDFWFTRSNASKSGNETHGRFITGASKDLITGEKMDSIDDGFKCGVLCLYLPGFAKGKPVRPKKEEAKEDFENVISRTVSLEKFECGSWASSAIINDHEDDSINLYFDLPLELIQTSSNDATSPVAAAFVFDKDRKGVLKSCSTKAAPRKSHESFRHVRFSTSSHTSHPTSPTSCITPRLQKAREDFNAFLEAQSA